MAREALFEFIGASYTLHLPFPDSSGCVAGSLFELLHPSSTPPWPLPNSYDLESDGLRHHSSGPYGLEPYGVVLYGLKAYGLGPYGLGPYGFGPCD